MTVRLDFFGPNARLHHVGMAVHSIEDAVPGLDSTEDPEQRVRVAFAELSGLPIELIEPAAENSPIDASLQKGNRLLHICLEVPSLPDALNHCSNHGFRKISREVSAVAFDMRRIVWVFSNVFGLVELLESESPR